MFWPIIPGPSLHPNFPRKPWERRVWELEHREVATPVAQQCTWLKTTCGQCGAMHRPHKDLSWPRTSAAVPRLLLTAPPHPPPTSMSSLRTPETSNCLCFSSILFPELLPDFLDKAFTAHPCFFFFFVKQSAGEPHILEFTFPVT